MKPFALRHVVAVTLTMFAWQAACDDEDGGVAAPVGVVVVEQVIEIGGVDQVVTLGSGVQKAQIAIPAGAVPSRMPVTVRLTQGVSKRGAQPVAPVVHVATRGLAFAVPARMRQSVALPLGKRAVAIAASEDEDTWVVKGMARVLAGPVAEFEIDVLGSGLWGLALVEDGVGAGGSGGTGGMAGDPGVGGTGGLVPGTGGDVGAGGTSVDPGTGGIAGVAPDTGGVSGMAGEPLMGGSGGGLGTGGMIGSGGTPDAGATGGMTMTGGMIASGGDGGIAGGGGSTPVGGSGGSVVPVGGSGGSISVGGSGGVTVDGGSGGTVGSGGSGGAEMDASAGSFDEGGSGGT